MDAISFTPIAASFPAATPTGLMPADKGMPVRRVTSAGEYVKQGNQWVKE